MKNIIFLMIFSISLSFGAKKAFVVGNGDYSGSTFSNLASSVNDAVQVTAKLKTMGYKVTLVKNGTKTGFEDSLFAFSAKLTKSDTTLFFFAGHGVEFEKSNYLIPSKPKISCSDNIRSRSIPLDEVVSEFTAKGCRFNLFFIDACRVNYVKSCDGSARGELETRGIAIQQNTLKSTNTAYIYASQSGEKAYGSTSSAGNGLFTSALLKYLGTPGDDISDLYRKVNNEVDSVSRHGQVADLKISQLKEKFYFVSPMVTQAKQDTVVKVVTKTAGDRDGDGFADKIDKCPDLVGVFENQGCPAKTVAKQTTTSKSTSTIDSYASRYGMKQIPGGTFMMGSKKGFDDEKPAHQVSLSPFFMDITEVTQKEYARLIGYNPSKFVKDNKPVEYISWFDAIKYCNARSREAGLKELYNEKTGDCNYNAYGFRLPTEAEWEYVAQYDDSIILDSIAWYVTNTINDVNHDVAGLQPNKFGLFDINGNVWEWCNDWYGPYQRKNEINPRGVQSGIPSQYRRVIRGGCRNDRSTVLRYTNREMVTSYYFSDELGFRVVLQMP